MKVHKNIRIFGRVQGVGFRFFTRRKAKQLGLTGFVQNEPDGTVYAEIEGEKEAVEKMLEWLGDGPPLARVDTLKDSDGKSKNIKDFKIRRE